MFTQALRDREFSRKGKTDLASIIVRKALDQVAKLFEAHGISYSFKNGTVLDFKFDMLIKDYRAKDLLEE